ncbi:hypothetical protein CXG81DRAFT_26860 [Caulochytrium protostelioides]|uniref:Brix-domain-containing protein n=1 Tax=Caulochytrium protostelioides TaxID=1555241 RepID=A0A4P9WUP7_9FUNG|nr:Brix-domain-containing protein [Caulochytrium protostelioides]RKP00428.1 hypothetical protein CXG81DRAFT_26860 [Caulochytrium protostelioides]|eukprot:RKP00428.1 hypothetical protein CXG81DRAFT_26860 [Caulochytrium protostelioides]
MAPPVEINAIKNKMRREDLYNKLRQEKERKKLEERIARRKLEVSNPALKAQRLAENVPDTLERLREADDTMVDAEDAEVAEDEATDEFASYFNGEADPKIMVTTTHMAKRLTVQFARDFTRIFPTAEFFKRQREFTIKRMVELAKKRDYTDMVVVNDGGHGPWSMTFIHLPEGPTMVFKLGKTMKLTADIKGAGRATRHSPELIMNNFSTRLGHTVGRMFASMFPPNPEFEGRQVATLHNQRDFIFFRRHRYIFDDTKTCRLQELGPRFSLKLMSLQKGTFDSTQGEYEWVQKSEHETSRRRFFL